MKIYNLQFIIYNLRIKRIFFIFLFLIVNFTFYIVHSSHVFAQSLSLSISPPILEVFIKPGKSVTQVYKLVNNSEDTVITAHVAELTSDGIKEDPAFVPEPWITLLNTDIALNKPFRLLAKETKQLVVRINPPIDAKEQDYYRALVFSTNPNPVGNSTQSMIAQNLASALLISVTSTGLIQKGAEIASFDLPTFIDSFGPLVLDIELQNKGKIYFRPNGNITLTGVIGKGNYKITPQVFFAGEKKKISAQTYLSDQKTPSHTLVLPGFFIGKYEVALDFSLDESAIKITGKKTFYALPFKASLVILALIMLIYLLGRRKRKK